jgi:cytochrome c-type biogenesis protein CcmE
MTPRQRRTVMVAIIVAGVGLAGALALRAFRENVMFYFDPSKVAAGEVKPGQRFRLGGMVVKDSVKRTPGRLDVDFQVTDFAHTVPVHYANVLPDLFREGAGVVALGRIDGRGVFVADEVLAKHDEKYMPPEVARSLKQGQEAAAGSENAAAGGAKAAAGAQEAAH